VPVGMIGRRLSYSHFTALQTALRPIALVALLAAGCNVITPYKMDIQQGNAVTQEMIAKLRPGMTRGQVRFALGTPLVVDPFRGDRWDYVYLHVKEGVVTEQRRIVVIFKDDKLLHITGDVVPAAASGPPQGGVRPDKPAAAPAGAPEKM
jgi:outer membrane protein assembly factor BamE